MKGYKRELTSSEKERLDKLYSDFTYYRNHQTGYPINQAFDYAELFRFLEFPVNNIGDPFFDTLFSTSTHEIEQEVVKEFSDLTNAPKDVWGYVTNGGTEGNMYGLYMGREIFPNGIVYFSEDAHYSIHKICKLINVKYKTVKSLPNGEIDYESFEKEISENTKNPAIVLANIGTTVKGAIDDIGKIKAILQKHLKEDFYIHCDAALSGMILPFVEDPPMYGFDAGIDSISVSGHKMIGAPMPCGIVLTYKRYVERIAKNVEYVHLVDTTINGSRNGITPLMLWYAFKRYGTKGLKDIVDRSLGMADYAVNLFKIKGINAWRNKHSITVVFPHPSEELIHKWQIAPQKNIAHIITMPHITKEIINELVGEIEKEFKKEGR